MVGKKLFMQSANFLTRKCNLSCVYCGVVNRQLKCEMGTEEWKRVFDNEKDLGFDINVLYGGEPFLRYDIFELIKYANDINLPYTVISNSTLVPKTIDKIKKSKLRSYTASVDTYCKDERSTAGIKALLQMKKIGVEDVTANIMIHNDNLNEIIDVVEWCNRHKIWAILGLVQYTDGYDHWWYRGNIPYKMFSNIGMLKKVTQKLIELKQKGYLIHNVEEYFELMPKYAIERFSWHCTLPLYYTVNADGSLMACPDWQGDTVLNYSIHTLDNNYVEYWKKDTQKCPGCYYNHAFQVDILYNDVDKEEKLCHYGGT